MTRKKLYLMIQTIVCILLCFLFSLAVIRIYREGVKLREAGDFLTWVYTREKVTERFGPIFPLLFGAVGFTIAGFVLGMKDDRVDKPVHDAETIRDFYSRKISMLTPQMITEENRQKKLRITGVVLAAVCFMPVFLYMTDASHFDGSSAKLIDQAFLSMLLHIVPWITIAFGCLCVTEVLRERSIDREVQLCKEAKREMKNTIPEAKNDNAVPRGKFTALNVIRAMFFAAAVILIIHGFGNGSMKDVFVKATNICTECIGLG